MSTHCICLHGEIRKVLPVIPLLSGAMPKDHGMTHRTESFVVVFILCCCHSVLLCFLNSFNAKQICSR